MLLILLPGTSRMLTKIFPTIFLSYTKSLSFNKIHKTTDHCKLICKIISVYSFLHLPTAFKKFNSLLWGKDQVACSLSFTSKLYFLTPNFSLRKIKGFVHFSGDEGDFFHFEQKV